MMDSTHLATLLVLSLVTWLVYSYHSVVLKRLRLLVKDCAIVCNLVKLLPGNVMKY